MSTQEQIQEAVLTENQVGDLHEIVLHNDDVNTFDHVKIGRASCRERVSSPV